MNETYPIVVMEIVAEAIIPEGQSYEEHVNQTGLYPMFGGYELVVAGTKIPFDFDASACSIEGNIVTYESGRAQCFNDPFLAEYYDKDYQAVGLSRKDITAEFLSKASELIEIFINTEEENIPFVIQSITFSDGENDYPVEASVIEAYNENQKGEV